MRGKIIVFACLVLCLSILSGCTDGVRKDPEQTTPDVSDVMAQETGNASGDVADSAEAYELAALQSRIRAAGCSVGIAFVDYIDGELSNADTTTYFRQSETVEEYPYLKDIKTVAYDGSELFVLAPATRDGVITVYPTLITDAGELEVQRDEVVCTAAPGEPIALRCNISESYSNVLVSVSCGEDVCEFYPSISLKDGWSVAICDGCYDFSIDNVHKYVDPAYYMLPKTYTEIKEALDGGSELIFAGDFYFCDQTMLRFELGRHGDDGFVCDKQYAVSFDATYAMDPADHRWYVIGAGVKGMGLDNLDGLD